MRNLLHFKTVGKFNIVRWKAIDYICYRNGTVIPYSKKFGTHRNYILIYDVLEYLRVMYAFNGEMLEIFRGKILYHLLSRVNTEAEIK